MTPPTMLNGPHGPHQPGPVIEPKQWRGPPWWFPNFPTTTTTLTVPVPGPTASDPIGPISPINSDGTTSPLSASLTTTPSPTVTPSTSDTVDWQTSSGLGETDTMPTDITSSTGLPTTTDNSNATGPSTTDDSGIGSNRTLVITLSTVLSAVGLVLIAGVVLICWRTRRNRLPFLSRGVSPIDDDEIAAWKTPRDEEKSGFPAGDTDVEADGAFNKEIGGPSHSKHPSTSSVKKPPSVIVYSNAHGQGLRHSTDGESRRSFTQNYGGKTSFDKALPQTPIQARAPNARAGLTDESIPGDDPFIPSPKRNPSRLSKFPPSSSSQRRVHHARARSSRSSTRSFGDYYGPGTGSGGSDLELSPRHSHDHVRHSRSQGRSHHSRVYSSSSVPPRLSFGDDGLYSGSSPARPLFRDKEIGRAIG